MPLALSQDFKECIWFHMVQFEALHLNTLNLKVFIIKGLACNANTTQGKCQI